MDINDFFLVASVHKNDKFHLSKSNSRVFFQNHCDNPQTKESALFTGSAFKEKSCWQQVSVDYSAKTTCRGEKYIILILLEKLCFLSLPEKGLAVRSVTI